MGLDTDLISEPSQTPSSTKFNIDHSSDEPATKESSRAEQTFIRKLRQAREFLQSPNILSRDSLAKRHKEIRDLLQTLKEEYGETVELDLELYDEANVWLHLRTTPDRLKSLAVGGKNGGVAVRPKENAIVLPEARESPTENSRSSVGANGRRSAVTNAGDTTPLGVPRYLTMEQALNGMGRRSNDSITKSQDITGQYSNTKNTDAAGEDTPRPKDSTSNISDAESTPFLLAETTHLQTLMSAQIERDLIHGKSTFLLLPRHTIPPTH